MEPDAFTIKAELYEAYCAFCEDRDLSPRPQETFHGRFTDYVPKARSRKPPAAKAWRAPQLPSIADVHSVPEEVNVKLVRFAFGLALIILGVALIGAPLYIQPAPLGTEWIGLLSVIVGIIPLAFSFERRRRPD